MEATVDVDTADVLRIIQQFLQEQGLTRSLRVLQEESAVALNTIVSPDAFAAAVLSGSWDAVLATVSVLKLDVKVLQALYDQILRELVEARELDAARALLRTALPLVLLKQDDPARHAKLEALATRGVYEPAELYADGGTGKDGRRQALVSAILDGTGTAPPSRLLTLLGQALKWQQYTGTLPPRGRLDLFRGATPARRAEAERPCTTYSGVSIKCGVASRPTAAVYAPDGSALVTGSIDGMIEVYDPGTARLRLDLPYQASDDFMLHEDAVLALAVSRDSELLASGGKDGKLKVWRLRSGECLRKFASAHGDAAVSAVAFSRDASNVLSGGGDGTARVFGLRSGNCLKEFRGHTSAVTAVAFLDDGLCAVTGSADGSARVWDVRSGECVSTIRPPQESLTGESPIVALLPVPRTTDQLILVPRAGAAYRMSTRGALLCTYTHARKPAPGSRDLHAAGVQISGSRSRDGPPPAATVIRPGVGPAGGDFAAACLSPLGRLLYAVTEDGFAYVFDAASGALEAFTSSPLHEGGAGVTGLAHAPHEATLASFAEDGAVKFWS